MRNLIVYQYYFLSCKPSLNAIAFDPYTHGYYKVGERVGEAFKDGLQLKK